jgi:Putative polyhydroxyalkanoic acid system protein (PHA_gran_rgn)
MAPAQLDSAQEPRRRESQSNRRSATMEEEPHLTTNTPATVSLKHPLGKAEAVRRLKAGFAHLRANLAALVAIEQEFWEGDTLHFHMRALGQSAAGTAEVFEDSVRIDVMLPWLLATMSGRLLLSLRKQALLFLEKQ